MGALNQTGPFQRARKQVSKMQVASPESPGNSPSHSSPSTKSPRAAAPVIVPDQVHIGMFRVRLPNGQMTDLVSLTRAKDAVVCLTETADRRQRGRQSPPEAPPIAQIPGGQS